MASTVYHTPPHANLSRVKTGNAIPVQPLRPHNSFTHTMKTNKLITQALCVLIGLSSFTAATALRAQTVPTSGLVGLWNADGNTTDSSGIGNNTGVTFTGGSYTTGVFGSAFSVNSSSAYVSIPTATNYDFSAGSSNDPAGDFSVDFWFNSQNVSVSNGFLGSDVGPTNLDKWWVAYNLGGTPANTFDFHMNGTSGLIHLYSSAVSLSSNQWYNVAVVKSGSTFTFYLNGSSIGTATSTASIPYPSAPLTFGYLETSAGMTGALDNIALYDRALSSSEVSGMSSIPEPSTYAALFGLAALGFAAYRKRQKQLV